MNNQTERLDRYLALEYPFNVVADPDGGYVIVFPDLPGCMTQVESLDEVGPMADEIRRLWIETEVERGAEIPEPSYPEEYSGKFVLRLPRSLHRTLAEGAKREAVSLNQYVVTLLARGDAQTRVERRVDDVVERLEAMLDGRGDGGSGAPSLEADLGAKSGD
jgi:antitoxin HicB